MTLDQLRYFDAAAALLHMGKAAKQENISQPSLSIAIKKLEKELGVPLFQPTGRGIELTEYGREFLPYAHSILQQVEAAKQSMGKSADQFNSQIHLAYTASVAYCWIPRLFREFTGYSRRRYVIYSDEMPSSEIAAGLKSGRFDLGICSKVDREPDIIQLPILYQPFVLLLPAEGEFSRRIPKDLEDACRIPFVAYRNDFPMYRQINALFEEQGLKPRTAHFAYSEDAIAQLVGQGLGISIVAETESLPLYQVTVLRPDWLTGGRFLYLTWHRLRRQGEGVRTMAEFIRRQWAVLPAGPQDPE